jgi:hypothetical protein
MPKETRDDKERRRTKDEGIVFGVIAPLIAMVWKPPAAQPASV